MLYNVYGMKINVQKFGFTVENHHMIHFNVDGKLCL